MKPLNHRATWWLALLTLFLAACVSDKAPQLSYQTIKGQVIQPSDYQGQVMLVNFWATSCTTCIKEMPGLIETHNKFKDRGFVHWLWP